MDVKRITIMPEPVVPKTNAGKSAVNKPTTVTDNFRDILFREQVAAQQVKLSAHAQKRLGDRNINLDRQDWEKINNAITKAEAKGAKNSLLIHKDVALIVSVTNRTVISAIDDKAMQEHVFTNIDSAVVIK